MSELSCKPYLRWAGSKRKILPRLEAYWSNSFDRYVEPFAGSSCLFFKLQPNQALLADKNSELIETHEVLRDDGERLYDAVLALPRNKTTYLHQRSLDPSKLSKFRRSVRFTYLNRNCFNGIFRTNLRGQFNVPWSGERTGQYPTRDVFMRCSTTLQSAELRPWDFGTTLRHCRPGDFVYMDPPYAIAGRRVFAEYGVKMFSTDDVERLSVHLIKLDMRGISFVVSYGDSREGRQLATGWNMRRLYVRRQIAGFKGARKKAAELLISNI